MSTIRALRPQTVCRGKTIAGLLTRQSMGWRSMPSAISVSNSTAIRTYTESFPKQPSFPEIAPAGVAAASTAPDPPEHISTSPKPPFFPESAADPYASWKEPIIHDIFEPVTGTWQYIVVDPCTLTCAIIDPVLDYDPVTQIISTTSADRILALVKDKEYEVERLLETHAHADHLSASSYLQARLGESQTWRPPIGIGRRIGMIQDLFGKRYAIPKEETVGVFQRLFDDDEEFAIGSMKAAAIHLPGHTPDHLGYKIGDNVFCGDSLFHADIGTARCDFPGGSADDLFDSGRRLLGLEPHVKIWSGHDYPPEHRDVASPYMTVQEHKELNIHVKDGIKKEDFVKMRNKRDSTLGAPRLLHQSLQINIRAGRLPKPTEGGYRLLHLPLRMTWELWGLKW